jgi:DNA-binding GntR family transcriptional regulator
MSKAMELKLNQDAYLPLRDVVFKTLRDAILRGDLKPGERLMEMHLAEELGVSRTPIREAIRMLEQEGLAITIPRKGAQVAGMTEKDLYDVLEIRDALDELAVSKACEKVNKKSLSKLAEAMRDFEKSVASGNVRAIVSSDERFHDVIYAMTDNPKLVNIVSNLREQMYRYRYEYVKDNADYRQLVSEHTCIVDGLRRQDKEYVKSVMHTHLENQVAGVRKVIEEQNKKV